LELQVALIPAQTKQWKDKVCIVVDVLRASSTLVTLLESEASRIYVTRSLALAYKLRRIENCILAGERHGYPPADFDFGNSPFRLAAADLKGKSVTLSTSNGTAVLNRLKGFSLVLAGCFLNAHACCQVAVEEAIRRDLNIGIVCAGSLGKFLLDDAVCVGYLVGEICRAAQASDISVNVDDAAQALDQLYHSYPSILEAFFKSESGKRVIEIGDAPDNEFCARIDTSQKVPVLIPGPVLQIINWQKEIEVLGK